MRSSKVSIAYIFKKSRWMGHDIPLSTFKNRKCPNIIFRENDLRFSWMIWSVMVSPKIKVNGVGAQGHFQKSRGPKIEKNVKHDIVFRLSGFSIG